MAKWSDKRKEGAEDRRWKFVTIPFEMLTSEEYQKLTKTAQNVFLYLLSHSDPHKRDEVWPSQSTMKRDLHIKSESLRAVQSAVKQLRDNGWVMTKPVHDSGLDPSGKPLRLNVYFFTEKVQAFYRDAHASRDYDAENCALNETTK